MKIINIIVAAIFSFGLSGCGLAYISKRDKMLATATDADFGPRPPANHQEIEKQMITDRLKDPESARFKLVEKETGSAMQAESVMNTTPILFWFTTMGVNAKNSYGGYVGFKYYNFAWRDGKVIAITNPVDTPNGGGYWEYLK